MAKRNKQSDVRRRKLLRSVGVAGTTLAFSGVAAANESGHRSGTKSEERTDTSDWDIEITTSDDSSEVETYTYVGKNKNAEPPGGEVRREERDVIIPHDCSRGCWCGTGCAQTRRFEVGDNGDEVYLELDISLSLTGGSADLSLCEEGGRVLRSRWYGIGY